MPATPTTSFLIDGAIGGSFGFASSRILLPGTPGGDACVRIANLGPCHITVKLGDVTAVVTQGAGLVILAGQVEYLTIGAATYIAGMASGGPGNSSVVNISTGS